MVPTVRPTHSEESYARRPKEKRIETPRTMHNPQSNPLVGTSAHSGGTKTTTAGILIHDEAICQTTKRTMGAHPPV